MVHSKMSVWDFPRGLENKKGEKKIDSISVRLPGSINYLAKGDGKK